MVNFKYIMDLLRIVHLQKKHFVILMITKIISPIMVYFSLITQRLLSQIGAIFTPSELFSMSNLKCIESFRIVHIKTTFSCHFMNTRWQCRCLRPPGIGRTVHLGADRRPMNDTCDWRKGRQWAIEQFGKNLGGTSV